ncbi:hypothetical protein BD408DRAFT_81384 [Parasitella parasitica]|nr:hypothetical protein BD408DRAFT_81384 [Parasitella parasitica]
MQFLLLLIKTTLVLSAIQAVNCRCVCDPADTTCLNNCVNTARNCIENCGNDTCFTECINVHWPGTTFEDGVQDEHDEAKEPVVSGIKEEPKSTISATARAKVSATDSTKTTTEADFIGALISAIFNAPPALSIIQDTSTSSLALETEIPASTSVPMLDSATPLLPLSEIASMLNLSNPLLTTTHTTITNMVTVTPTAAPSSSITASTTASFGVRIDTNLLYPSLLFVLTIILMK